MKKILLSLLLIVTMVLAGCGGGSSEEVQDTPVIEAKQYGVGETGTGEHYNITLMGGETAVEVPIGDTLSDRAGDGYVFLMLGLKLENITDEEQEAKMWDATVKADGRERTTENLAPEVEIQGETYHRMGDETILAPGETMMVYAATMLPEDWQSCEFTYDGVTFVVSAEEATPPPAPPTPVYQVGEAAQTENYNVTLVMGESMKHVEEHTTNPMHWISDAEEGQTFLILLLDIANTSDETRDLFDVGNFKLTVDGEATQLTYFLTLSTLSINGEGYENFIAGSYAEYKMESGAQEVRYVVAQIPEDWNHFELTFDGAIFAGDNNGADAGEDAGEEVGEDAGEEAGE